MSIANTFIRFGLFLLITAAVIGRFTVIWPNMPSDGLDPSWMLGINQAVAQKLKFGAEMIFTYGPYAGILSKSYHPDTDFICNVGGFTLGAIYAWSFIRVTSDFTALNLATILALFSGLMLNLDSLAASYIIIAGIVSMRALDSGISNNSPTQITLPVILAFIPFGLLPLIKGSFLAVSLGAIFLTSIFFIINKQYLAALATLGSPLISTLAFWSLAGQAPSEIAGYFNSMSQIISGYTDAMSLDGDTDEAFIFALFSTCLIAALLLSKQKGALTKNIYIASLVAIFLYISFKAGFVRHDLYHALTPAYSVLISTALIITLINNRLRNPIVILSFIVWTYIDSHSAQSSTRSFIDNTKGFYYGSMLGITNMTNRKSILERKYQASLNSIAKNNFFPLVDGTADVYSSAQSALIASGNNWNPRPVLQSYSAYTKPLAIKNRAHLLSDQPPSNIFFKVDPIDTTFPSMQDGASWPVILHNYNLGSLKNDYALLTRKSAKNSEPDIIPILTGNYTINEKVYIPQNSDIIFASITLSKTLTGKLISMLYKPSQLTINVNLVNGESKSYKIVPGMAEAGFVMSPLIQNTYEFTEMNRQTKTLNNKAVVSFSISPNQANWDWHPNYQLSLMSFNP
jgi:hypothetical protein